MGLSFTSCSNLEHDAVAIVLSVERMVRGDESSSTYSVMMRSIFKMNHFLKDKGSTERAQKRSDQSTATDEDDEKTNTTT